jgi:hypothetical protein
MIIPFFATISFDDDTFLLCLDQFFNNQQLCDQRLSSTSRGTIYNIFSSLHNIRNNKAIVLPLVYRCDSSCEGQIILDRIPAL